VGISLPAAGSSAAVVTGTPGALSLSGLGRASSEREAFLDERQHNVELFHRSRAVNHELRSEIFILMRLTPPQVRVLLTPLGGKTEVQTRVGYAVQMHRLKTIPGASEVSEARSFTSSSRKTARDDAGDTWLCPSITESRSKARAISCPQISGGDC
jgi:hypothetical protein